MGDLRMCACDQFRLESFSNHCWYYFLDRPYIRKKLAILLTFFSEAEFENNVRYRTSMADLMLTAIRTPKIAYQNMRIPLKELLASSGLELLRSERGRRYKLDLTMCVKCFKLDPVRQLLERGRNNNGAKINEVSKEDNNVFQTQPSSSKDITVPFKPVVGNSIQGKQEHSRISDCVDPEECVSISLKKVSLERRNKTKEKILRLVKLIADLNLDPDEVRFSVTTK